LRRDQKFKTATPDRTDVVPPPDAASRSGILLYRSCETVDLAHCLAAEATLGTNKIWVWGRRAQHAKA